MTAFRTILVRVLAIALAWSVALSPVGISESHDTVALAAAEAERHAELASNWSSMAIRMTTDMPMKAEPITLTGMTRRITRIRHQP